MTHEEYVADVRAQIVSVARLMLEGTRSFIEGAREINSLRHEAEVAESDADFDVFVAIDSETDALPIGNVRKYWSPTALERLAPTVRDSESWAREVGTKACHAIITRFGI
jgi:hypothetical protein